MIDLSTKAGALRFAELRRNEARAYYLWHGALEQNPIFWLFVTHRYEWTGDPENLVRPGRRLPHVDAWPCRVPQEVRDVHGPLGFTRFMGYAMATAARATKAVGSLYLSDSWLAPVRDLEEDRKKAYGWIEKDPERREGLLMRLEHKAFARPLQWSSMIERDPLRLGDWMQSEAGGPDDFGRLTDIVDWKS